MYFPNKGHRPKIHVMQNMNYYIYMYIINLTEMCKEKHSPCQKCADILPKTGSFKKKKTYLKDTAQEVKHVGRYIS